AIRRKALPKDHPDIASSLTNLGNVQRELREYAETLRSHQDALAIYRQALPEGHPLIASSLNNLGAVPVMLRAYGEAWRSHEEGLAIRRKALPEDHPDIASSLNNLGMESIASAADLRSTAALLAEAADIKQRALSRLALSQAEAEQLRAAAELRTS